MTPQRAQLKVIKPWAILGLAIVIAQIFLGAWTSTNYAALACPNFPFCQGSLFPHMSWLSAFNLSSPIGPNYEGGRLAMNARVTIQMAHRYGAMITAGYVSLLAITLIFCKKFAILRPAAVTALVLLLAQFCLGILNIELTLPMWTAVLHNGVAVLLLLTMITILHKSSFFNERNF